MTRDLLARAAREGTPLIDGDRATFVWRGSRAPQLIGDFTHWASEPLVLRRSAEGVWTRSIAFYEDAYVEYAFLDGKRRLREPLNTDRDLNGIASANHSFYRPQGERTPFAHRRPNV